MHIGGPYLPLVSVFVWHISSHVTFIGLMSFRKSPCHPMSSSFPLFRWCPLLVQLVDHSSSVEHVQSIWIIQMLWTCLRIQSKNWQCQFFDCILKQRLTSTVLLIFSLPTLFLRDMFSNLLRKLRWNPSRRFMFACSYWPCFCARQQDSSIDDSHISCVLIEC